MLVLKLVAFFVAMVEFLLEGLRLHYKADCINNLFFTDENSVSASSTNFVDPCRSSHSQSGFEQRKVKPPIGMMQPSP